MNKSLFATTLLTVALFACSKKEEAPAQAPAEPAAVSTEVKPAATESTDAAKEPSATTEPAANTESAPAENKEGAAPASTENQEEKK